MKYLFIGGSKDGEWLEVHNQQELVRVFVKPDTNEPIALRTLEPQINEFATENYFLHELIIGGKMFKFYYTQRVLSVSLLFTILINNYRPTQNKEDENGLFLNDVTRGKDFLDGGNFWSLPLSCYTIYKICN